MRIVIDAQLPFGPDTLGDLGEVVPVVPRDLGAAARNADALVVRSVTRVDEALLTGSRVRFVGSATSGTDHVDLAYLRRAGIRFADAAGCNAVAVAEYVAAALFHARSTLGIAFHGRSIGIVGCGHVGRVVARFAGALGMRVVMNDPPLARATCEPVYRPLEQILECDFVSLHVPLERGGPDPTYHLVNEAFLARMKPGAVLINASRGGVVDSAALRTAMTSGRLGACVLDVWEHEPDIDPALHELVAVGTAHIAGHTIDAKRRALEMIRKALLQQCGRPIQSTESATRIAERNHIVMDPDVSKWEAVETAIRSNFDIAAESERLCAVMRGDPELRAQGFDALRSGLPSRREFAATEVTLGATHPAVGVLGALGFNVVTPVAAVAGAAQ